MAIFCAPALTSAHDLPISHMRIVVAKKAMHAEIVLNSAELNFFSEIDLNKNGFLDSEELEEQGDQIAKLIFDCFSFQVAGQSVTAAVVGIVPHVGSHHLTVRAHYPVDARKAPVSMKSRLLAVTRKSHVIEVTFQRPDGRDSARLNAHDQVVLFDYEKEKPSSEKPVATTDASSHRNTNFHLLLGLAALLGSFFLFRGKRR